ncbi:MAG: DUF2975 domain-containing protein [Lachnospiraceae bacterium]|nr:DUF2975 domain-containing protein [Lachnospiraceae bacterium]
MNQKKMSILLKGIAIMVGIMGALFLIILMPMLAKDCKEIYKEFAYLYWPGICYGWLIGIICFGALYQFWKICNEIGKDNSFSMENIKSLNTISMLAFLVAAIWFAGLVGLIMIGSMSISFFLLMSLATLVSLAISIIAIVLSHLVRKAYELKQESELTI